jgi:hypothetical protein
MPQKLRALGSPQRVLQLPLLPRDPALAQAPVCRRADGKVVAARIFTTATRVFETKTKYLMQGYQWGRLF